MPSQGFWSQYITENSNYFKSKLVSFVFIFWLITRAKPRKHYIVYDLNLNVPDPTHSAICRTYPTADAHFELRDNKGSDLPLLVFAHQSDDEQTDRWCLLGQCMVYLHLASALGVRVDFNGEARPVVMACYTTKSTEAEIYLMTRMENDDVHTLLMHLWCVPHWF